MQQINRTPGVHYATTSEGIDLPIVDVTHPAFALDISEVEMRELLDRFLREGRPLERLPKPLRNLLLRFFLRGSVLAGGIRQARGTFMTGMHTYLLKLGPEMLGAASSKPIDRRIAGALPALCVRLRLQDVARMMADALAPALRADRVRPLHFVNIAGGPAIDTLNALILLRKEHKSALGERRVSIDVLDLDDAGPAFGNAALAALSGTAAPLYGMQVAFRHVRYDWAHTADLTAVLRAAHEAGAIIICSSEGGLFEYGSDDEIEANLKALRAGGDVRAVVGSVTRADEPTQLLRKTGAAAIHPRGLAVFRSLVENTGWRISRVVERPFSDQVLLT